MENLVEICACSGYAVYSNKHQIGCKKMNTELTEGLVEETRELISFGQKVVLQVSANIVKLRENLYPEKNQHSDFVKWCYQELNLKSSAVSKYEAIGDYYFLDGKYTPDSFLHDGKYRDYEVVYASTLLPTSREENYSHALTWSRDDFKEQKADDSGPHTPDWVKYCKTCGRSEEKHL